MRNQLTTRKATNFRLPFDVLERVDRARGEATRTDVLVEALELWLAGRTGRAPRRGGAR